MGNPIRIIDLAVKMIHLSGFEPRDSNHPDGDIEIKITGLRPGEKLSEELIIGNNVYSTDHPQILKAEETSLDWGEIEKFTLAIKNAVESLAGTKALTILKEAVVEWDPEFTIEKYSQSNVSMKLDQNTNVAEC
jgi:FlaA1/EpsC-like NDP-sugar epimerase